MITETQATLIADAIQARLGDTAVAAALLRAREAEEAGDARRRADWTAIARKLAPADA